MEIEKKVEKGYKIGVIGSEILATGFKLAGVKIAKTASNGEEAEKALEDMLNMDEVGIIIIAEGLSNKIKNRRLQHIIDTSLLPLVIEVPDYGEKEVESDTLRRLILRAVGIDITKSSKFKG